MGTLSGRRLIQDYQNQLQDKFKKWSPGKVLPPRLLGVGQT
jgi:hypothetical protein